MTKKSIYTSGELPDHDLDEFEEIRRIFLVLIMSLAKKHSGMSIHAGLSRAHLDMIIMGVCKGNLKEVLMKTADYFLSQAEKIKEEDDNTAK